MKITICTIIKDEHRYLEEWIKHCLSIGFCDIHLYEDYGSLSHKNITDKYENVYLHSYDEVEKTDYKIGDKKQIDLFNHFVNQYRDKYDWCAFIDPDEYIRFADGYNFEKLCKEFSSVNGIMIQQKTYGANNHIIRPNGGVQENYTENPKEYHKIKCNMKTIVNLKRKVKFKGVHRVDCSLFTNKVNRLGRPVCYEKCWYDHYYTKSWQDWLERFTTRGDVVQGNVKLQEFFIYNNLLQNDALECSKQLFNEIAKRPSEKKKMLIIGNKIIQTDIKDMVESFDFVVRYNKMDNSDKTGLKCDLYGILGDIEDFKKNISQDKLKAINEYKSFFCYYEKQLEAINKSISDDVNIYEIDEIKKYFGDLITVDDLLRYQSMLTTILYCIYHFSDEYDIYAVGFDINRDYIKDGGWHIYYQEEHKLLFRLSLENKFIYIPCL